MGYVGRRVVARLRGDVFRRVLHFPISYFDRNDTSHSEQTPVYAISFELYENGISRALALDYDDFVVSGEMSQLQIKDAPECK